MLAKATVVKEARRLPSQSLYWEQSVGWQEEARKQ